MLCDTVDPIGINFNFSKNPMKKILLWFFLFLFPVVSFAFVTPQTYNFTENWYDLRIEFILQSWDLYHICTYKDDVQFNVYYWACRSSIYTKYILYNLNENDNFDIIYQYWSNLVFNTTQTSSSTSTHIDFVWWVYNFFTPWSYIARDYNPVTWSSTFRPNWTTTYIPSWNEIEIPLDYVWSIEWIFWSPLVCTTETIPSFDFIDITPQIQDDVAEVVIDTENNTAWYGTSLSWENPLQVIFTESKNITGFAGWTFGSWSVSFSTESFFLPWSTKPSIDILWTAISSVYFDTNSEVDLYTFDSQNNISLSWQNIDFSDYQDGFFVWETPRVKIVFDLLPFGSHTIGEHIVKAVWSNTTQEVEICYNEDDDEYTIDNGTDDPYAYEWDPYADLVGTPTPTELTFSDNGFEFFENGFCLKDFVPVPGGWELSFDIIDPQNKIRVTYPLWETWVYKYWFWTCSKITTNYHAQSGQYYVRPKYTFQNTVYFPKWENYFQYTISEPEQIDDTFPTLEKIEANCWNDTGAFAWVVNFFDCGTYFIKTLFSNIWSVFTGIKDFFVELWKVFTTETRDFTFFPKAHASYSTENMIFSNDMWNDEGFKESKVWEMYAVSRIYMFSMLFLFSLIVFWVLLHNKKNNG